MVKENPEIDAKGERPRDFGEDEGVEKTKVNPAETDIFEEVLKGKKAEIGKVREAIDKNDEEVAGGDAEEEWEEEDDETEEEKDAADKAAEEMKEEQEEEGPVGEETGAGDDEAKESGAGEKAQGEGIGETPAEEQPKPAPRKRGRPKKGQEGEEVKEEIGGGAPAPREKKEDDEAETSESSEEEEKEVSEDGQAPKKGAEEWEDGEFDFDIDHDAKEPEELSKPIAPPKEEIRETILAKAQMAAGGAAETIDEAAEKLAFLTAPEQKGVFIGRKGSIYKKYGFEAALQIGKVQEKEFDGWNVHLDSLNPHVVFVCGARGSGKSYVLGVIAEELSEKNKNVGIIVVDPIGVFWSMKFPNNEEREVEKLREQGLEPKGLAGLKVFIPEGMKGQVPKSTYDAGFSIQPSLLTGEDWALTFGVDRFSVSGLLLDKVIKKVEQGYKKAETNEKVKPDWKMKPKGKNYSLQDLIECLETDSELNSREKGYKQDSIRAIISRFEAAKSWGIFHEKGTPLGELSREGQLTILDTSFLEDNVTALVIGILARRLLAARKISTRKEAANRFKSLNMNELLELEIPPTWLFIDEAHTLIPSGNEVTAATAGLIEYVKQGRRPGLSLVFATQQPSAINTKVLSQLDVIMTHKLIFDDDIKAVIKRTPTIIPRKYRNPNFIKTLPVGVAVTGDRREETSRAFVMAIRPRKSQHEGRDAETTGLSEQVDSAQVARIAAEMLLKNLKEEKEISMERAKLALDTLNAKYKTNVDFKKILKEIEAKGAIVSEESIKAGGYVGGEEEEGMEEVMGSEEAEERSALGLVGKESIAQGGAESEEDADAGEGEESGIRGQPMELLALPQRISEEYARKAVDGLRKKRMLGLLGAAERIDSIRLKYFPIWRVKFDSASRKGEFIAKECFVNSLSGEFVHFKDGHFMESKGLSMLHELGDEDAKVLKALQGREMLIEEIMGQAGMEEGRSRRVLQKLMEKGLAGKASDKKSGKEIYWAKEKLDLPPNERHELLGSLANLPFVKTEALSMERENFTKEQAADALRKLWGNIIIKKIDPLYKPVWHIVLSEDAKERVVLIDAVTGKILSAR